MTNHLPAPTEETDGALKLAALDADGLAILSAHVQDAVLRRTDAKRLPGGQTVLHLNRFDWAHAAGVRRGLLDRVLRRTPDYRRRRSALVIDHVTAAMSSGMPAGDEAVLNLLGLRFEPETGDAAPAGRIVLTFSGGAMMRLDVECCEVRLDDLGPVWSTASRPRHRAA